MMPEGASASLTKIAEVDRNNTPNPNEPYRNNVECIQSHPCPIVRFCHT